MNTCIYTYSCKSLPSILRQNYDYYAIEAKYFVKQHWFNNHHSNISVLWPLSSFSRYSAYSYLLILIKKLQKSTVVWVVMDNYS